MIEQGGSSLYGALSLKCNSLLALRIATSIGGTEAIHFELWNDLVGDAPPVDSGDGLVFPDLNTDPATATDLVMPRPCKFISEDLPPCSVIRPTSTALAGAVATVEYLTATGLFVGQSEGFFRTLARLASAAGQSRAPTRGILKARLRESATSSSIATSRARRKCQPICSFGFVCR